MKNIYIIIFIIGLHLSNSAQNIIGAYTYKSADHLSGNRTITFFKNKTFSEEFVADMGTRKGKGNFTIKDDILTLSYQNIKALDSSQYKLEQTDKIDDHISRIN